MKTNTRTIKMSRQLTRTTGAGIAGIAMLLSAASVLAQGAGGGMSRPDDRSDRMDRAPRIVERRVLRHDDVVPLPPQQDITDRVIERRGFQLDQHGGGPEGGTRTQGLSERLEHRIRVLEERIRVLSDALRSKLHERRGPQSRGDGPARQSTGHATAARQHESLLRHFIERRPDAPEERGEDRGGGRGQPHRGQHGPHVIELDQSGPGGPSGTWEMRIDGLDGRNLFRGQLEHAPDGPHGHARGSHPGGPGNDQHEFIIQLHGKNDQHGSPGPNHGMIEDRLDGPRSGPGTDRQVIEKRIIIDDRNDEKGPRPAQQRTRIRLDDSQRDNRRDAKPRHIIIEEQLDTDQVVPPAPPAPPPRTPRPCGSRRRPARYGSRAAASS